jgi:hypothetical protein
MPSAISPKPDVAAFASDLVSAARSIIDPTRVTLEWRRCASYEHHGPCSIVTLEWHGQPERARRKWTALVFARNGATLTIAIHFSEWRGSDWETTSGLAEYATVSDAARTVAHWVSML